jgi:AraC family transcriptional regulator, arabinose operon regulatory protein
MERGCNFLHSSDILNEMRVNWDEYKVEPRELGRSLGPHGLRTQFGWSEPNRDNDLWVITGGRGKVQFQGKWTHVRRGSCLWFPTGTVLASKVEQDPDNPLNLHFIHFLLVDRHGSLLPADAPLPPEHIEPPDVQAIEAMSRRLVDLAIGFGTGVHALLPPSGPVADIGRAMLTTLLMDLDHHSDTAEHHTSSATLHRHVQVVRAAALRIKDNATDPPSVEELAAQFGYSRHHFSRVFQQVTRMTPQEFAIDARIQRAQDLLTRTDMKIGKVAELLGYRDSFFFSRQFKRQTGMTPTRFRRGS